MKTYFPLLLLPVVLMACGGKKAASLNPEVTQDFTRYLTENNLLPARDEQHLYVLLHPGFCGSCTEAIQAFVKKELEQCPLDKTLIVSSDREDVTAKFAGIRGLRIVKDTDGRLARYGLANGLELFMTLHGGKAETSGLINTETEETLSLCAD